MCGLTKTQADAFLGGPGRLVISFEPLRGELRYILNNVAPLWLCVHLITAGRTSDEPRSVAWQAAERTSARQKTLF